MVTVKRFLGISGDQTRGNNDACGISTAELHLYRLIGMASYPDIQKIGEIGFFFENILHWQFLSSAVTVYAMYLRLNLSTTPDLEF